jgi:hypothetical protein
MDDFYSWVNDPNNQTCKEGKKLARKAREKGPRAYWESLYSPELYAFGIIARSPATGLRLICRCIESLLGCYELPEHLAEVRKIAIDEKASQKELRLAFDMIDASERGELRKYEKWRFYYQMIWNLLRWRLGMTKPTIAIDIIKCMALVLTTFRYPTHPFHGLTAFMKKEVPYEEWLQTYEEWNERYRKVV